MDERLTQQIKMRLESLVNDSTADVSAIADWALETMQGDDPLLEQEPVWRALDELSGADSMTGPGSYLYGPADFRAWLEEFTSSCPEA
ncbi:hypothetical protein [Actinacidiphila paucisporea]|uniref:Uncharacterized protein n=1 Tax=Actinacidiphila paucisporea TaxID=310782 RepID=A0A1M7N264_9ACTN|nr:hypothetical protein [Actinacidiphila paucisporea]SHM97534.1 hypothetical protein SAMN05216499_11799 [Actinacidiphila paucisporea]